MKVKFVIVVAFVIHASQLWAQNTSFDTFLRHVMMSNPYALKAELIAPAADMEMRFARGAFDPKLQADFQQKRFDNTEYYRIGDANLSIPTFIGLKAEAGFQQNDGTYLNNQLLTPDEGLAYIGLSMPVLQGLRTDEARTAWQIASIQKNISLKQRQWTLNELLYRASVAYSDFSAMSTELAVLEEGISNSKNRLEFVRNSFLAGDKAAIDTTEARLQIQIWEAEKTELIKNLTFAYQQMAIYQWNGSNQLNSMDMNVPSQLDSALSFVESHITMINSDSSVLALHPRIAIGMAKIKEAELKRKLAGESLKPQLNVKYNFLRDASQINTGSDFNNNFNSRDYHWGLSFGMPLFLRKERAKIQLARIAEREAQLDYEYTFRETQTYIQAALAALNQSQQNAQRNLAVVTSYQQLLEAEQQKSNPGESSLFILNSRESKWIESKRKLIKSRAEVIKSSAALIYAKGGLDWVKLIQ